MAAGTDMELVNAVRGFYNDSWSHLFGLVTIIGVVGGILIPLATWFYQRKLVAAEELRLNNAFDKKLEQFKRDIEGVIDSRSILVFSKSIEEFTLKSNQEKSALASNILEVEQQLLKNSVSVLILTANMWHERMERYTREGNLPYALAASVGAMHGYLDAKKFAELRTVCQRVNDAVLKDMKTNPYIEPKLQDGVNNFNEILNKIEKNAPDGAFSDDVKNLRVSFQRVIKLNHI